MAAKKAVNLSKLTFNELKDKAKEVEGVKAMNRFEIIQAVKQADNQPLAADAEKSNPRKIKPEIAAVKAKLAEATEKKARKDLRREVSRLKRESRKYL